MPMSEPHKSFWYSQFDKLLISVMLLIALAFLLHVMHHSGDSANVNQAWGVVTFFLGLLSGLITGRQLTKHEMDETKGETVTRVSTDTTRVEGPPE